MKSDDKFSFVKGGPPYTQPPYFSLSRLVVIVFFCRNALLQTPPFPAIGPCQPSIWSHLLLVIGGSTREWILLSSCLVFASSGEGWKEKHTVDSFSWREKNEGTTRIWCLTSLAWQFFFVSAQKYSLYTRSPLLPQVDHDWRWRFGVPFSSRRLEIIMLFASSTSTVSDMWWFARRILGKHLWRGLVVE